MSAEATVMNSFHAFPVLPLGYSIKKIPDSALSRDSRQSLILAIRNRIAPNDASRNMHAPRPTLTGRFTLKT